MNTSPTMSLETPIMNQTGAVSRRTLTLMAIVAPVIVAVPYVMAAEGWPLALRGVSGLVLVLALAASTVTDLHSRRIRNWVVYPAVGWTILVNALASLAGAFGSSSASAWCGGIGIGPSLLGGLLCFSGMFVFFIVTGVGAGDVKLMAVIGAIVGWFDGFQIWLCAMLLAAAFSVCLLVGKAGLRALIALVARHSGVTGDWITARTGWTADRADNVLRTKLPLAPFFACATAIVVAIPEYQSGRTFLDVFLNVL